MTLQEKIQKPKGVGFWRKAVHGLAVLAVLAGILPAGSLPAQAVFGAKTLTILHMHTGESATITFARGGRYDQQALDKLNWLLRDWRTDEPTKMDPRLFDLLAEVYDESGSRQPIRVVSAYRSPKTNSMLRRRSKMVAEHSQHMLGKAMDFYLTDVSPEKIRAIGMKLQFGGVGYYPRSNTPFIHLDVGGVRAWPRMTRAQLTNLFPDGKTVHIPADGRPLPGYEEAKAIILARGGKVAGESYASAGNTPKRKSFWATLFGGRDEEEDEDVPASPRGVFASRNRPQQVAAGEDSDRPASFFTRQQQRGGAPEEAAAPPPAVAAIPPAAKPEIQSAAASEPVPLPPVRQVATVASTPRGPQMIWQAGAPGQPANGKEDPFGAASTGSRIALASNEARRPGDGNIGSGAMTYAPLPPARPGTALAAIARRGAEADLADAPITTASIAKAPMPPARPAASAIKTAALAPAPAKPKDTGSRQPARREEPARTAAVPAENGSPKAATKPAAKTTAPIRHALLKPKPLSANAGGFSQSVYTDDLATSQFSGSAFKASTKK